MSPRLFADLHCHPTLYNFNRMRNSALERDPERFHPWTVPPSDLRAMARGVRAAGYSQCDVAKLVASRTRVVFASSTPIERGFFELHGEDGREHHPFAGELLRLLTGHTLLRAGTRLVASRSAHAAAGELTRILKNRGPLRVLLQKLFLKYGVERIRFMMSPDYDYWQEFLAEYDFWRARDGVEASAEVELPAPGAPGAIHRQNVRGRYHLVRSLSHYDEILETPHDVAFLVTIEGGHVLSVGPDGRRLPADTILERIAYLKSLPHPVVFLTLAHHFDNGICGHAHSIPDLARLVMDQTPRMNTGLERQDDLGLRVARALLAVDAQSRDTGEGRVLIDFKHLSAQSRKELYAELYTPFNARHEATPERPLLPVIFSHAAYAGRRTLDELIESAPREHDHFHAGRFYAWNINLCDEDVRMVHASHGLIGLCFEQRICGVGPRHEVPPEMWSALVRDQLFGLVDAVILDQRLSPESRITMWDRICLGTDYDGMIDPLKRYPTALDFDRFAEDLRAELTAHRHTRFINQIGVDTLVEKICWRNADAFLRRHLPAARAQH